MGVVGATATPWVGALHEAFVAYGGPERLLAPSDVDPPAPPEPDPEPPSANVLTFRPRNGPTTPDDPDIGFDL